MDNLLSVSEDPNVFMLHRNTSLTSNGSTQPLALSTTPLPNTSVSQIPKVDLSGIVLKPRPKSLPPGSSPDPTIPGNGNTLLYKNVATLTSTTVASPQQPLTSSTIITDPVLTLPTPGTRRPRNPSESDHLGSSTSSVRSGVSSMPPRPPKGIIGSDPRPLQRRKYNQQPSTTTTTIDTPHRRVTTSSTSSNASVTSMTSGTQTYSEKRLLPSSLPQLLRSESPTGIEASTIVYESQQKKLQINQERKALIQEYMKEQRRLRKLTEETEKQAKLDQEKRKRESINNLRLHQQQSVQKSSAKSWTAPAWNGIDSPRGKSKSQVHTHSPIDQDPYYENNSSSSRSYENSPTISENYDSAYTSPGTTGTEESPLHSRTRTAERKVLHEVHDNKQSKISPYKNPTAGSPTSTHQRGTKSSPSGRTQSPTGRLQGTILRQSIYKMVMNTVSSDEESVSKEVIANGSSKAKNVRSTERSPSSGRLSPEQQRLFRAANVHSETGSLESNHIIDNNSEHSPLHTEPSTAEEQNEYSSESSPLRSTKIEDSQAFLLADERLRQVDELREQVQTLAKQLALLQQTTDKPLVNNAPLTWTETSNTHTNTVEMPTPYEPTNDRVMPVDNENMFTVHDKNNEYDHPVPITNESTNYFPIAVVGNERPRSLSPPPPELPRVQLPNDNDYKGLDATDRMELFMNRLREVTDSLPNPPSSTNYSKPLVTAIENIANSDEDTNYETMMASHREFLTSSEAKSKPLSSSVTNNIVSQPTSQGTSSSDPITRLLLEAIFDTHDEHSLINAISAKVPHHQPVPHSFLPVAPSATLPNQPMVTIETPTVIIDQSNIGQSATTDQSLHQYQIPSQYISDNQTAADIIKEARDIVQEVTASAARSAALQTEKTDNRSEPRLSPDELYFRLLASIDGLAAAEEGVTALATLQSAQAEIEAQRQTLSLAAQFQQQSEAAAIAAQLAEIADEANHNMETQQATVQATLETLYRQQAEKTGEITASLLRELSMAARNYNFNDPNHHPGVSVSHHHHHPVSSMQSHSHNGMSMVGSTNKKGVTQQSFSNIVSDSSYGDYTEEFESEDDRTVREERSRVTLPHGRTGIGRMPSITSALSPRSSIPPEAIPEDVIAEHEGDDSMDAVEIAEDSVLNEVNVMNQGDSVHSRIIEEVPEDDTITEAPLHAVNMQSSSQPDNQALALRHSSSKGQISSPQHSVRSAMIMGKPDTSVHPQEKRGKSKVKIMTKGLSSTDRNALVQHDSLLHNNDGFNYNIDEIIQDTLSMNNDMGTSHDTNELFNRFVTDLKLRQQQDQNLIDLRTRALHNKCSAEIKYIDRQITKRKSKLTTLRQDIVASSAGDTVASVDDIELRYAKLKKKMEKEMVQLIESRRRVALKFKVNQAEISKERADMGARYYRELLNFQQQIGRTKMFEESQDDTMTGMENSFETYNGKLFSGDSLDLDMYDPTDRNKRSYDVIADALLAWDQNRMNMENTSLGPVRPSSLPGPSATGGNVFSSTVSTTQESTITVSASKVTSPKVKSPLQTFSNATSPRAKTSVLPLTNPSVLTSPTVVSRDSQDETDDFYEDSFASASRSTDNQVSSPFIATDVPEEIVSTSIIPTEDDTNYRKQLAELELERYMNEVQLSSPVKSLATTSLFTVSGPLMGWIPATIDQIVSFDTGIVIDSPIPEPIPVSKVDQIVAIEPSDILSSVVKVVNNDGQINVSTTSNQVTKMNMQDIVNSVSESFSNEMLSTIIKDTDMSTINPPTLSVNATSARAVRPIPSVASPTNASGVVPLPPGNGSGPIAQMGSPNASALSPRTATPQKSPSSTSPGSSPYGRDDMFLSPNSQQRSSNNAGISPNSASTSFDEEDDLYDFDSNIGLGYNIGGNTASNSTVNSTLAPRPSAPGPGSLGTVNLINNVLTNNGKPKDSALSVTESRTPVNVPPTASQIWETDALSFLDELAAVSPPESFLCLDPSKPCLSVELYLAVERDRELNNRGPHTTPEEMEALQIRHKLIFDTINEELVRIARNHKHAFAHIRTLQASATNGNVKAQESSQRMIQDLSSRIKSALRNRLATLSKSIDHSSIHDPTVLVNRVNAIVRHEIKHTDDLALAINTSTDKNEILQHITEEITESLVNEALQDMVVVPRSQ